MAAGYVRAALTVQPEGPYCLVGHSFGGLIAFEMARQLCEAGREVALLAVIDHPGPNSRVTPRDRLLWHLHSLSQLDTRQKVRYVAGRMSWSVFKNKRIPGPLRKVVAALFGGGIGVIRADYPLKWVNATMTAMQLYQPGPYPGPLTLYRARLGYPAINADPTGGWGGIALGRVSVEDFDCDHAEIFNEPHVGRLGAALRRGLEQAEGGRASWGARRAEDAYRVDAPPGAFAQLPAEPIPGGRP
jgi:thioesterase domain-containing protein